MPGFYKLEIVHKSGLVTKQRRYAEFVLEPPDDPTDSFKIVVYNRGSNM